MPAVTVAAMREIDRIAIDELCRALVVQPREVADGPVTMLAGADGNWGVGFYGGRGAPGASVMPPE